MLGEEGEEEEEKKEELTKASQLTLSYYLDKM